MKYLCVCSVTGHIHDSFPERVEERTIKVIPEFCCTFEVVTWCNSGIFSAWKLKRVEGVDWFNDTIKDKKLIAELKTFITFILGSVCGKVAQGLSWRPERRSLMWVLQRLQKRRDCAHSALRLTALLLQRNCIHENRVFFLSRSSVCCIESLACLDLSVSLIFWTYVSYP